MVWMCAHFLAKLTASHTTQCDRARSPACVSQKREYLQYSPETIADFALRLRKSGVQRQSQDIEKTAIGGHIYGL
jgi:hypothetical protein